MTELHRLSRRIVAEYGLEPGDRIREVRAGSHAAIVVTEAGGRRVEQVESADDLGVDVYVLTSAVMDAHASLTGIAVTADGRLHRLADAGALRELWRAAPPTLRPAAMARLVAEWAGSENGPRALLDPDGRPLVEETDGTGRTHVALRTEDGTARAERWDVVLGPDLLDWRHRTLEDWER